MKRAPVKGTEDSPAANDTGSIDFGINLPALPVTDDPSINDIRLPQYTTEYSNLPRGT
jgi:hypothetical protein